MPNHKKIADMLEMKIRLVYSPLLPTGASQTILNVADTRGNEVTYLYEFKCPPLLFILIRRVVMLEVGSNHYDNWAG